MKYKLLTSYLLLCTLACFAQNATKNEINLFAAKTGAVPTIDRATNALSFLRFPAGKALKLSGVTAQEKAFTFIKQHQGLFNIQPEKDSYLVKKIKKTILVWNTLFCSSISREFPYSMAL
ncbi:hypothetical protein [Dyadobacter sp. NIV53]|uniref:hypothetical protein n=1 Tax=Dyadobacter sp. NIV53 TaxID=2861765 RepID=UPI001C881696|nr:hypothetical protein [Dyadobacter sp. NIV53]